VPQVGELDRTTYTVSIEASFAVVLFPVCPLSSEETTLFWLAGR
jgi:hypothetical protein